MPTLFTRILSGELPGRFVWRDERCGAFLAKNPLKPGHTLVVPNEEVDHWIDLPPGLGQHLFGVAQTLSRALQHAFRPRKVGLMVVGLEVHHVHLHLVPIETVRDMDFDNQDPDPRPEDMDAAAERIRGALRELGLDRGASAIR